jgi:hypothetical protein
MEAEGGINTGRPLSSNALSIVSKEPPSAWRPMTKRSAARPYFVTQ